MLVVQHKSDWVCSLFLPSWCSEMKRSFRGFDNSWQILTFLIQVVIVQQTLLNASWEVTLQDRQKGTGKVIYGQWGCTEMHRPKEIHDHSFQKQKSQNLSWEKRKLHRSNHPDPHALVTKRNEKRRQSGACPSKPGCSCWELEPKTWVTWHLISTHYHTELFL